MAAQEENVELESAAARSRPIELITENGFSIVRPAESDGPRRASESKFVFIVSDPEGSESEIAVSIDPQAVNEITLRSRGRISSESSYWVCCAERHLAEYLWKNNNYPPGGKLRVDQLTIEDVNLAIRWETN